MVSRVALHKKMMVAYSRLLIVMSFSNFVFRCLRDLFTAEVGHPMKCQNLSSGHCTLHTVKQVSPGSTQFQSAGMMYLIRISYWKVVGELVIITRRSSSALMFLLMLKFLLEFHTVLWASHRNKFLINLVLEVNRSSRHLNLLLESTVLELNLMTRIMPCYRETQVCLNH